jgi:hypothetical protein
MFDPFSSDFFNAPFATYRRMRNEEPVYYSENCDFYALTRCKTFRRCFPWK